ncbi:hypothetical protein ACTFIZ_010554 [Dictyostelium cf. discoideum]
MEEKIKFSFEINDFQNQKFKIQEFTSKLIGLKEESFTPFKPIVYEKYLNWAKSIEESILKTNGTINKSIFEEIFSYCGHIGEFLEYEPFMVFLKFTTFGIILDDFIFEKINSLNMKLNEKEKLINSLTYYNNKNENIIGFEFWEIINEFQNFTHKKSFERIKNANSLWIKSSIDSRKNSKFPINSSYSFNQYFEKRSSDASGDFILTMSMIGIMDNYIENSILGSKEFQIINYHAKSFFLLINDLYSFNREINDNDLLNYIKILAIQLNSIQMSIDKTIELIIDHYLKFLSSIEIILKLYQNDQTTYQLLKQVFQKANKVLSGIYFAHKRSKRYN